MAEAQAMALTELAARAAVTPGAESRMILLAADDYSAVSRRVPLSNLYERGRSLGLGIMVSAQSWEGLGEDDDERQRIVATADGGIWIMRTPAPEKLVILAGTRTVVETGRKLIAPGKTGDEGSSRVQHTWIADPDRIRRLETGQACYIRHGSATYLQVAPAPGDRTSARPAPQAQAPAPEPDSTGTASSTASSAADAAHAPAPEPAGWPYQAAPPFNPAPAPTSSPDDTDVIGPDDPGDPASGPR